jgi:RNA polymerase sigma-70 factor (ECF subfamily)
MSRIARNAAIDKGRLKSFQNHQKTEEIKPYVYSLNARSQNSSKIDVDRLLKNLDEKHKAVIDFVYLMGYTQAETAEALNMPLGTVKTRLRSAISLLRNELKDEKKLFLGMLVMFLILLLAMIL